MSGPVPADVAADEITISVVGADSFVADGSAIDSRLIEDRAVRTSVRAAGARSADLAVQGDAVPMSRGRPCAVAEQEIVPCPFTDGGFWANS